MEGIFTLPYSEFEAVRQFQKLFPKNKGYSVFVPVSRQQAGIDFPLLNCKSGRTLRVQLKSSRAYIREGAKHFIRLWYNNFLQRYYRGVADVYVFFGLYPVYTHKRKITEKAKFWKSVILVFEDAEMERMLHRLRTKAGKMDRFFSVGFDAFDFREPERVYGTRGQIAGTDLSRHLLRNKVSRLRRILG
jgi:hypothetical protein